MLLLRVDPPTGGSPARVEAARAIVEAGVAVMGHVGLTPQSVSVLGEWLRFIWLSICALHTCSMTSDHDYAMCRGFCTHAWYSDRLA
jgi:hypothetical protein